MAEIKISLLPEATQADGAVVIPVVQGGVTKKITLNTLLFDDCIGAEEIKTDAVGASELSNALESQLLENFKLDITPASGFANQDDITSLTSSINTKTQVHYGNEAPDASNIRAGDLFVNTSNDTLFRSNTGSEFDQIITVVPDLSITNDKIANTTIGYDKLSQDAINKILAETAVKIEVDEALESLTVNSRTIGQLETDVGTFINTFTINADQISGGIATYSGSIDNLTINAANISSDFEYAGTGDFTDASNAAISTYTGDIENFTLKAGNIENTFNFSSVGNFADASNAAISSYNGDITNLNITTGNFDTNFSISNVGDFGTGVNSGIAAYNGAVENLNITTGNFDTNFAFTNVGDFGTAVSTGIAAYNGAVENLSITTGNFDTNFAISSVGDFTTGVSTGIAAYQGAVENLEISVGNLTQNFDFSSHGNFSNAVQTGVAGYNGPIENLVIDVGNLSQTFNWNAQEVTGSSAWQNGIASVVNTSFLENLGFVAGDISSTINWDQYLIDNGTEEDSLSSAITSLSNTGINTNLNSITQISGDVTNGFTLSLEAQDITATINVGNNDDWLNQSMAAAFINNAVNIGINNVDVGSGSTQALFDNFFSNAKVTGAIKTSIGAITGDVLVSDNEGNVSFDVATLVGDITGDNLTVNVANLIYTPSGGGADASFITGAGVIDDNVLGDINASKLTGTLDFTSGTGNVSYTGLQITVGNIDNWDQTVNGIQNTMVIDGTGATDNGSGTGGTIAAGTITSGMISQTGFTIDASKVDNLTLTVEDGIVNSAPSVFTFNTDENGKKGIAGVKGTSIDQTGFSIEVGSMTGNLAAAVNQIQNSISLDADNLTGEIDFGSISQTGLTINANAVANTANAGTYYDTTTSVNDSADSSSKWAAGDIFKKNNSESTPILVRYEDVTSGPGSSGSTLGYIPSVSGGGFSGSTITSSDLQNFVAIIDGAGSSNSVQFLLDDDTYRTSANGRVEFIYFIPSEFADDFGQDASNSVYWSIGANNIRYEPEAQKVIFGAWTKTTLNFGSAYEGVDKPSTPRFIQLIKAQSTAATLANATNSQSVTYFGTQGNTGNVIAQPGTGDYKIIISSVKVFGGTMEAAMTQIQSSIDNLDLSATISANNISGGTLNLAASGVNLTGVNFSSSGNFGIASGGGLSPLQLKNEDWNSLTATGDGTFATAINSLVAGATISASNVSGGILEIGAEGINISGINQSHLSSVDFANLPAGSTILSTFNSQVQSVSAGLNIDVSKVKIGEGTAAEADFAEIDANGDVTFNFGDTSIVGIDIDFASGAGLSSSSYDTFTQTIGSITVDLGSSLGTDANGNIDFSNSNLSFAGVQIGPSQIGAGALGSGITIPTDQLTGSVTNNQLPTIATNKLPSIPGSKLTGDASTNFSIDPGDNIKSGALGTGVTVAPDNLPGTDDSTMFDYIGTILNNSNAFNLIGSTLTVDVGNLTINTGDLSDAVDVTETDDQGNETTVKKLPSSKLDVSGIKIDDLDLVNSTFNLTATVSGSGDDAAVILNVSGEGDNIFDVDTNGNVIINQTIIEKTIIESQIIQNTIAVYSTIPFSGDSETVTYMSGGVARSGTFYIG